MAFSFETGGGCLLITPQDFELYNSVITAKTLFLDFVSVACAPFLLVFMTLVLSGGLF